jgi:hypothetical protein
VIFKRLLELLLNSETRKIHYRQFGIIIFLILFTPITIGDIFVFLKVAIGDIQVRDWGTSIYSEGDEEQVSNYI